MGKGIKRKSNPGVGVDFKRVKTKVGKKLPKAQNDTDTSFKAASINLPNQALTEDREGVAVNAHNLALKELLSQTSHYSEKARKSALLGLADLFTRHPQELTNHVGPVYTKLVERMGDGDADVRKALARLLREQCIPNVEGGALRPFMPMIMAHVCSAMTHLSLEVRNDALVLLDVLMDHCPELVVGNFLCPCIQHFCDLLSPGQRGSSMKAQSIKVLLKVLHALTSFLDRAFPPALSSSSLSSPWVPPATATTTKSHFRGTAKSAPLFRDRCAWPARALYQGGGAAKAASVPDRQGAQGADSIGGGGNSKDDRLQGLALRLLQLLCSCWLECSPGQLRTSPEMELVQALLAILTATHSIVANLIQLPSTSHLGSHGDAIGAGHQPGGAWERDPAVAAVECLLQRVAPNFPACVPAVRPPPAVLETLAAFNLQAAQLLASFLPLHEHAHAHAAAAANAANITAPGSGPHHPKHPSQGKSGGKKGGAAQHLMLAAPSWVHSLMCFFTGLLQHGVLLPAASSLSEAANLGQRALGGGGAYTVGGGGGGPAVASAGKGGNRGEEGAGKGGGRDAAEGGKNGGVASAGKRGNGSVREGAGGGKMNDVADQQAAASAAAASGHAAVFLGVLRSVEDVVGLGGGVHAGPLLGAVDALAMRSPARSPVRAACLQLQHGLLRRYQLGELYLEPSFPAAWLSSLPKLLWELGTSNPSTSMLAQSMLHNAARFCVTSSTPASAHNHHSSSHATPAANPTGQGNTRATHGKTHTHPTADTHTTQSAPLSNQGGGGGGDHMDVDSADVGGGGWEGGYKEGSATISVNILHTLASLQPQLAPLFAVQMPAVSSKGRGKGRREGEVEGAELGGEGGEGEHQRVSLLAGPVTKLGTQLQELAVDCVYHMFAGGTVDPALLRALLNAMHAGLLQPCVAQRCMQVLLWRLPDMPAPTATSTLVSLLFPLPTTYTLIGTPLDPPKLNTPDANPSQKVGSAPHSLSRGACWSTQSQALADTVLGVVQAFAPAGAVLGMLSDQLQARVGSDMGIMSGSGGGGGGGGGGGQVGGNGGVGKMSSGSISHSGGLQVTAQGLPPLQLLSLLRLVRLAALESRASKQQQQQQEKEQQEKKLQEERASKKLQQQLQARARKQQPQQLEEEQQHPQQQQQPQQSQLPAWLDSCVPKLAVHACVRCALLAGAAPAPIPAPLPPLAAAGAAPTLIQGRKRGRGALDGCGTLPGQAEGWKGAEGAREILAEVVGLVVTQPDLTLKLLQEAGNVAEQLWGRSMPEAGLRPLVAQPHTAGGSSSSSDQQQLQDCALVTAHTLLALVLSVLHQTEAVQQLLLGKLQKDAYQALAKLSKPPPPPPQQQQQQQQQRQQRCDLATYVRSNASWAKEAAHLDLVACSALGLVRPGSLDSS